MRLPMYFSVLLTGLLLTASPAYADLSEDMGRGLGIHDVVKNALNDGMLPSEIIHEISRLSPEYLPSTLSMLITLLPERSEDILQAAIDVGMDMRMIASIALASGSSPALIASTTLYAEEQVSVSDLLVESEDYTASVSSVEGPSSPY